MFQPHDTLRDKYNPNNSCPIDGETTGEMDQKSTQPLRRAWQSFIGLLLCLYNPVIVQSHGAFLTTPSTLSLQLHPNFWLKSSHVGLFLTADLAIAI